MSDKNKIIAYVNTSTGSVLSSNAVVNQIGRGFINMPLGEWTPLIRADASNDFKAGLKQGLGEAIAFHTREKDDRAVSILSALYETCTGDHHDPKLYENGVEGFVDSYLEDLGAPLAQMLVLGKVVDLRDTLVDCLENFISEARLKAYFDRIKASSESCGDSDDPSKG